MSDATSLEAHQARRIEELKRDLAYERAMIMTIVNECLGTFANIQNLIFYNPVRLVRDVFPSDIMTYDAPSICRREQNRIAHSAIGPE